MSFRRFATVLLEGLATKIGKRLGLQFYLQGYWTDRKIVNVHAIGELLKTYETVDVADITRAVAGGAGYTSVAAIPAGKRYTIFMVRIVRDSGDGTLTLVHVCKDDGSDPMQIYSQTAGSGVSIMPADLTFPLVVEDGYGIQAYCNALTGDSSWSLKVYAATEDAIGA